MSSVEQMNSAPVASTAISSASRSESAAVARLLLSATTCERPSTSLVSSMSTDVAEGVGASLQGKAHDQRLLPCQGHSSLRQR